MASALTRTQGGGSATASARPVEELAELEISLRLASRRVNELAAQMTPRCVHRRSGPGPSASEGIPALSREQEVRIAANLHDLSAGLSDCAQLAALTSRTGLVGPGTRLKDAHGR